MGIWQQPVVRQTNLEEFAAAQLTPFSIQYSIFSRNSVSTCGMRSRRCGLVAIGRAQMGFRPSHIFKNENPHTFFVSRYAQRLSPRPLALVMDRRSRREDADELATLYQMSGPPHRLERIPQVDTEFLLKMLHWIGNGGS